MNKNQLITYQAELWPAVCAAQGWDLADKEQRRATRAHVWEAIGEEERGDAVPHDEAAITALFTYLRHLAEPNNITLAMAWDDCRANYRAYNKTRQADHWQRRAYGRTGGKKLWRNRFAGRRKGQQQPDDALTEEEADQRLMTMRARAKAKEDLDLTAPPSRPAPRKRATRQRPPVPHTNLSPAEEIDIPF
jgi:hypothetical protein